MDFAADFGKFFFGASSVIAIIGLVNLIKKIKDIGNWSALVAVIIGIGIQLWVAFTVSSPTNREISMAVGNGLIYGLMAVGLYDLTNPKVDLDFEYDNK